MVEIIVNDREQWDTTKKRLSLPDAAMPGVHSLRREVSNAMTTCVRAARPSGLMPRIKPEGKEQYRSLTVSEGALLIDIYRRKASENNRNFGTTVWTPRKVDKILWTYGREV